MAYKKWQRLEGFQTHRLGQRCVGIATSVDWIHWDDKGVVLRPHQDDDHFYNMSITKIDGLYVGFLRIPESDWTARRNRVDRNRHEQGPDPLAALPQTVHSSWPRGRFRPRNGVGWTHRSRWATSSITSTAVILWVTATPAAAASACWSSSGDATGLHCRLSEEQA